MSEPEIEVLEPEVMEDSEEGLDLVSGDKEILSPEMVHFAKLISEGTGPSKAYRLSHPKTKANANSISHMAYQLARNPKVREQISTLQEAVRLQLITEAPAAFERVKQLAETAKAERVKLDANLEILDRAGLKPPQRVESIQIGLWGSLSRHDMQSLIRRRLENQ